MGVDSRSCPVEVAITAVQLGRYLGHEALENGIDVGISSWRRMAQGTFPANAKIGGQYINSQLIIMEAIDHGYQEGIALDTNGYVSEGSGENIFMVYEDELWTPPISASILLGVTRKAVLQIATELGISVREEMIPREMLYIADELFFSGHRRGDYAHPVGGRYSGRRGQARPDDGAHSGAFLQPGGGKIADKAWVADGGEVVVSDLSLVVSSRRTTDDGRRKRFSLAGQSVALG